MDRYLFYFGVRVRACVAEGRLSVKGNETKSAALRSDAVSTLITTTASDCYLLAPHIASDRNYWYASPQVRSGLDHIRSPEPKHLELTSHAESTCRNLPG